MCDREAPWSRFSFKMPFYPWFIQYQTHLRITIAEKSTVLRFANHIFPQRKNMRGDNIFVLRQASYAITKMWRGIHVYEFLLYAVGGHWKFDVQGCLSDIYFKPPRSESNVSWLNGYVDLYFFLDSLHWHLTYI